jgi:molybdate transport system substrate-binding protein
MRVRVAAIAVCAVLLLAGCGSGLPSGPVSLTAFADESLSTVFPRIVSAFSAKHPNVTVNLQFGPSGVLASQIAHGVAADVFAGSSELVGDALSTPGLIEAWKPFASDRLVLLVGPSSVVASWRDLDDGGVRVAIEPETTIGGAVTRIALGAVATAASDPTLDDRLLAAATEVEDAGSVISAVVDGRADVGLVFRTDALAAGSSVRIIDLPAPASAQGQVVYPIAVVTITKQDGWSSAFVDFVLGDESQALLADAGFGPPTEQTPSPRSSATP